MHFSSSNFTKIRTTLGELTTLSQTPSRLGRGTPISIPSLSTDLGASLPSGAPRCEVRRAHQMVNTALAV